MEEQYKQVTNIILELAGQNPFITKEQIAKAKSMYNGDTRSIEIIRAELEAYSAQILAQGLKAEEDKKLAGKKEERDIAEPVIEARPTPVPQNAKENSDYNMNLKEQEEIYEPLRAVLPDEDKQRHLQSMIDDALGGRADDLENDNEHTQGNPLAREQGKVLVKSQPQETSQPASNDGGYGNVTALLALTIMFSIVTIIMAFFTIIAN